jgi:hypothetical protein
MATVNNPFDLSKTTGKEMLTAATTAIAAPTTTGYNAATSGATGYTSKDNTANEYTASKWDIDTDKTKDSQTVQGQVAGLIAANSPLMQQAEAASKQQMNQRGLLNTSMAVGAGQEAVIKQALPIAQQDATLFANQAKYGAESGTAAAQYAATAKNQTALANQTATNTASQFTAGAANQANLANAAAQNQAAQFTSGAANVASQQYSQALNATVNKMLDQSMTYALANADAATKIELQNIDAATRKDLAATEAAYKNQMQASASANDIFAQVSANISNIMMNGDLDTAAKQTAVTAQKTYLQGAMNVLSVTSKIPGLKDLISFT